MRYFLFALLLLPAVSLAAETQAGFPTQAIWISKTTAVAGETLIVSAVVYNGNTSMLKGTLVFTDDTVRIGVRELELPAGESQIHSIEWISEAGEHRLAARIEGTSAALSQTETPSITVIVAEPPPPSGAQQVVSQAAETVGNIASSSLPVVLGVATNIFNAIEPYRQKGVEELKTYVENTRSRRGDSAVGAVAGTSTSNTSGFRDAGTTGSGVAANIAHVAAAAALFVMSSLYLFYPLLALVFLGTLYFLARRIKRPE
ncbi:hypothetical protein A3B35_01320 [Candidatus Kaiserbacteria bacterium RIFCSPLOWO2_01_FULL_54_24]|uniref:CARDB domain-containing protein n=1 Tax=Candidatus Kaiserbacteria bacterium RIFCSPLOWO2_01_FULL_54_24 TaxID=1798515 RepID=A0A1F6EVH5_9BACT|nr:MAG: hypothetical protein A3B35_01320 [Candidatus Kaiserbacteria bacterium RIFCSPLOWO2_01_FULL_54_24]